MNPYVLLVGLIDQRPEHHLHPDMDDVRQDGEVGGDMVSSTRVQEPVCRCIRLVSQRY